MSHDNDQQQPQHHNKRKTISDMECHIIYFINYYTVLQIILI
jgi:hypothetical protein